MIWLLSLRVQWEDFTAAELSSFLRVLDVEEANHELQIRERYQLLSDRLREAMMTATGALLMKNEGEAQNSD